MQGWIDGPGHCRNLTSARYEQLGMACTADDGGSYPTYWTQVFGRTR